MDSRQLERLFARILFKYNTKGGREGREIMYAYNRQVIDSLNIKRHTYDNSQFIEVGNIIELEGHKCKVIEINFKLEPKLYEMIPGVGINIYSPTDPTDYNCQIGVFVERLDD